MNRRQRFPWAALLIILLATTLTHPAVAVVNGPHVEITPWAGYAQFDRNVNLQDEPIYGGKVGFMLNRYLGLEGHIGISSTQTITGFTRYAITPTVAATPRDVDVLHYGVDLVLNIRPSLRVEPYLLAGWQEAKLDYALTDSVPGSGYENGFEFGGGLKFTVAPRVAIRLEARDAIWKFAPGTPSPARDDPTHNVFMTGGIQFSFGGVAGKAVPEDFDGDGVPDKTDKCPDTPVGARVDATGCPIDGDGDGVWDGIDQCPNTPSGSAVDARGCPSDADNDGVPNGVDQCPDTPAGASVDATGCPKDADNDGVPDGIDQCADTPSGMQVDAKGCPAFTDADNDGVPDDKDLCPFTSANAKVDKDGCPIVLSEREVELLDKGRITERNIHFVTAKWDILPESSPVLDEIGKILIQWPRLTIEIGGHADSRGSDAYNRDLSNKRANAVLEYLLARFPQITREQYSAKGYGESMPVASNKTVEGMAHNRRVEFKVLNTEELKKERERRSLLQKGE